LRDTTTTGGAGEAIARVVHRGPGFRLGDFVCPPTDDRWGDVNWVGPTVLVAFPMRSVVIRQPRHEVVTDPNIAVFYEADQRFTRELADPRGDRCTYVEIDEELMDEIAPPALLDAAIPVDARLYMAQWSCIRSLASGESPDRLAVDDLFIGILTKLFGAVEPRRSFVRSQADLVADTRSYLTQHLTEPLTLDEVARAVHSSPYHLSRTFHRVTGSTLRSYLTQLRLRASLERVWDPATPLDRVACELGFSSHSHFTARFRDSFGVTPSVFRKQRL
jgi:AraC family transcriptional regulator